MTLGKPSALTRTRERRHLRVYKGEVEVSLTTRGKIAGTQTGFSVRFSIEDGIGKPGVAAWQMGC